MIKSEAYSVHFKGRVRRKLTNVCNNDPGIANERLHFLAMFNLLWKCIKDKSNIAQMLGTRFISRWSIG